jgi:hypothetical protein
MSREEELTDALDRMLGELSLSPDELGLELSQTATATAVTLGGRHVQFRREERDWELEWERLLALARATAERAQLAAFVHDHGLDVVAPWVVFVSGFTFDWLVDNAGGIGSATWRSHILQLFDAALTHAPIQISTRGSNRLGLEGHVRNRRLASTIRMAGATHHSRDGRFVTDARIPETAVIARGDEPLGTFVEHPLLAGRRYQLLDVTHTGDGTEFLLSENWRPLVQSPDAEGGPERWPVYARWAWNIMHSCGNPFSDELADAFTPDRGASR